MSTRWLWGGECREPGAPLFQFLGPRYSYGKKDTRPKENPRGQRQACPTAEWIAGFRVRGGSPTGTGERGQGLCPGPAVLTLTSDPVGRASDTGLPTVSLETPHPQAPLSSGRVCRVASGGGPRTPLVGRGGGGTHRDPFPPVVSESPLVTRGAGLEGSPTVPGGCSHPGRASRSLAQALVSPGEAGPGHQRVLSWGGGGEGAEGEGRGQDVEEEEKEED